MFRLISRIKIAPVVFLASLSLLAGCRNPFNPSADIEIGSFEPDFYANEISIYPSDLPGGSGTLNVAIWAATATFVIKNKVGATVTSINVVYTDYAGNPVTVYKATGGKSYRTNLRLHPMNDDNNAGNYSNGYSEGNGTQMKLYMVDRQVVNEITAPGYPPDRNMFAIVTFRGEDDNGYDFKLIARIGIKYYL